MTRFQKAITHTLLDLALELGHNFSFAPHVMGVYIYRSPDCKATDTLYLDKDEDDLIRMLDKITQQAYDL